MMVYFTTVHLFIGSVALFIVLIVLWKQKKSFSYMFFLLIFWIYMMGVVSVIVFPFPIGIPNANFKPDINLVPFDFGCCDPRMLSLCIRNLYENILLTIPFGFGISFIARIKPSNIVWLAIAVGFVFELSQLVIALIFRSSFRTVDINDVILNAAGVLIGYGIFRIFGWLYSAVVHKLQAQPHFIFAYIYDIVRHQN